MNNELDWEKNLTAVCALVNKKDDRVIFCADRVQVNFFDNSFWYLIDRPRKPLTDSIEELKGLTIQSAEDCGESILITFTNGERIEFNATPCGHENSSVYFMVNNEIDESL